MKIKSLVCGSLLLGCFFVVPSCATSKGTSKNMDERRAVANKTEEVIAKVEGIKSVDAVYTKTKQLRIFVETTDGKLTDELVAKVKKEAAAKNGISEDNVVVFTVVETSDQK